MLDCSWAQVPFCGVSICDYLETQPELALSLTLCLGSEVAYMFGTAPTQRAVLFAPTDAAWTAAAATLGAPSNPESLNPIV